MPDSRIFNEDEIKKFMADTGKWYSDTRGELSEEMAEFFAKRLDQYEDIHLKNWGKEYQYIATLIPPETKSLLDIGCGTGLELDEIFKHYPALHVIGIDLAESMLTKLAEKHPDKNLELINADYFAYPFDTEKFDAAVSFMTLHHFKYEKKGRIYKKLYEALGKGGRYIECDYMALNGEHEKLCLFNYEYKRKRDNIPENVFVHMDIPLTIEHQIELMRVGGFRRVEVLYQNGTTVFIQAYK